MSQLTPSAVSKLLKVSAVLWVVWGLVHVLAGVLTISGDTATAVRGIADAVEPELLEIDYPDAVGAIVNQHGWNLLWGGAATIVGAAFIWRHSVAAIFITAMVGGLLDIGYLLFIDLGGYNNFVPGTVMTIISATAILLSFLAYFLGIRGRSTEGATAHPASPVTEPELN